MALTDYTSYAEIRGVLGVSDDELTDTTLGLAIYASALVVELQSIAAELPAAFATVKAISAADRTTLQANLYEAVTLFSAYAVADRLASSLPLFAAKSITDGKAAVSRDSGAPYAATIKRVREDFNRYLALLDSRYTSYLGSSREVPVMSFLSVSSPSTNPVTDV